MTTTFRLRPIAALLFSASLIGCAKDPTGPALLAELPRPLTASEQMVISASNRFAFDLLREIERTEAGENLFISPLSVSMALGMTLNGAAGSTFDAMRSTLAFGSLSQGEINATYRSLIDLLLALDRRVEMGIANSIWHERTFPFQESFFAQVRESFDAEVAGLDFGDPGSPGRINSWVRTQTRDRITEILNEIPPDAVMYLINAIYFKGQWTDQFPERNTVADEFAGRDGRRIPVRMMNTEGTYRFAQTPAYQAIDLPYGNGAFTMTVVLPAPGASVEEFIGSLDAAQWDELTGRLSDARLLVSLPRFRLEYEKRLKEPLTDLGMGIAFSGGLADFSGMSPSHGRALFISEVMHKSFVEVDEEGTEAAAVTSVEMRVTSAPPSMRVDRPFFFVIRERFSGTILFAGKVVDPS